MKPSLYIAGGVILGSACASVADSNALNFWRTSKAGQSSVARLTLARPIAAPLDIKPKLAMPRFRPGRLKCARNVNAYLQSAGYRGTGSDMAKSFLNYGREISSPRVGAIQVEKRGRNPIAGHVQVVDHQKPNGVWMCRNPSSRVGAWTTQPCANPRVIAYRMPTEAEAIPTRMYAGNAVKPRHTPFPQAVSAYAPPQGQFGAAMLPASFVQSSYGSGK